MPRLTEEKMLTPDLLRRFALEATFEGGAGPYYALMLRDNGDLLAHHPLAPSLDPAQLMFAADMLKYLNKEVHHNGAWVICFTHPKPEKVESVLHLGQLHWEFGRYALMWLDADGDLKLVIDWMEGSSGDLRDFAAVLQQGPHAIAQKAEAAWQMEIDMREVLDLREGQTFKRAQGERAASTRH